MKKILFLLPMLAALFASCSSDDSESTPKNNDFTLEKSSVSLSYRNEAVVGVSGIDPTDAHVESEDDFIAYAYMSSVGVKITASHVGQTILKVTYGDKSEKISVEVTGVSKNYIGNPVLEFGMSKSEIEKEIKSNGGSVSESATGNGLVQNEYNEEVDCTHMHAYRFKNDKLVYVYTMPNISFSSGSKLPFMEDMSERYQYVSYDDDAYWYQHPGKFLVKMTTKGLQKGEVFIEYGETKNDILEYSEL